MRPITFTASGSSGSSTTGGLLSLEEQQKVVLGLSVDGTSGWQTQRHLRADCLDNVWFSTSHKKHTCGPPRTIMCLALHFICWWWSYLTGNTPMGLHILLRKWLYPFKCRWYSYLTRNYSTACYGNTFTLIHLVDIRTSQETSLWFSTNCYGGSVTVYMYIISYFTVNTCCYHYLLCGLHCFFRYFHCT
jgi:hypothetical protein